MIKKGDAQYWVAIVGLTFLNVVKLGEWSKVSDNFSWRRILSTFNQIHL